jgi:hypothetical protein
MRCLFVEKDPGPYSELKNFATGVKDLEIETLQGDFTERVSEIQAYIQKAAGTFPFIFIDPTGWNAVRLPAIAPLLQLRPAEVLINFMTSHVTRFLEEEDKDLDSLFEGRCRPDVAALHGQDRDDAIAFTYADGVRRSGRYDYVGTAVVLNPLLDRTHFHLIYATRHPKGISVFKETEKSAAGFMRAARAEAKQRNRVDRSMQGELFDALTTSGSRYQDELRTRYLSVAKAQLYRDLQGSRRLAYEDAWKIASRFPLVWESDLHHWLKEWSDVRILGMKPNQRVPHCDEGIMVEYGRR